MENTMRNGKMVWGTALLLAALLALPVGVWAAKQNRGGEGGNMPALVASMPMEELSADEKAGLLLMVEEEKLARDVYNALFAKWNLRIFSNIARSEETHMNAVSAVLTKYGLENPNLNTAPGEYSNPELQSLYNDLVEKGSASLTAALQVGATVEDLDIKDLEELIAQADNKDIRVVYQNLVKGSRNHIRSFTAQLKKDGVDYQAQFISAGHLAEILASPHERGAVDEAGRPM